jgi:FMN phosphatase YigB (HAD superfamily)
MDEKQHIIKSNSGQQTKIALFDLDGTLLFTDNLKQKLKIEFENGNFSSLELGSKKLESFVKENLDILKNFIPDGAIELLKEIQEKGIKIGIVTNSFGPAGFAPLYKEILKQYNVELDCLVSLRDIEILNLTNGEKQSPISYSRKQFMPAYDDQIFRQIDKDYGKPHTLMFEIAMKKMGIDKADYEKLSIVMVGDGENDINFGHNIRDQHCKNTQIIHLNTYKLENFNKPQEYYGFMQGVRDLLKGKGVSVTNFADVTRWIYKPYNKEAITICSTAIKPKSTEINRTLKIKQSTPIIINHNGEFSHRNHLNNQENTQKQNGRY